QPPAPTLLPYTTLFRSVLCNVPARIGPRAVAYFLDAGRALLEVQGELRAVVIRDLREQVERSGVDGLRLVAEGRNHLVYSVPPRSEEHTSELQSLRHLV